MNYYTQELPIELALKLQGAGMPCMIYDTYRTDATFAEALDFFLKKGMLVNISRHWDFADEKITDTWDWDIEKVGSIHGVHEGYAYTWHEAATKAIEKALEIISKTI